CRRPTASNESLIALRIGSIESSNGHAQCVNASAAPSPSRWSCLRDRSCMRCRSTISSSSSNPSMLAKYREAFKPSRAKDDPTEPHLALDLLLPHRDRLNPLKPQSVQMRTLLYLVEQRRRLVGDKTRFTNRLGYALKQYFPQALDWFERT